MKPAPSHENPVLASRLAKLALYRESLFDKTIYMDCDICLLLPIDEVFDFLDAVDLLVTEDVQPAIAKAANLLRVKQDILSTLQSVGLPLNENSIQYNTIADLSLLRKAVKLRNCSQTLRNISIW